MPQPIPFEFDYPLHVIRQGRGFAAILGQAPGLGPRRIPVIFTQSALAEKFISEAAGPGEIQILNDQADFTAFLRSLPGGMNYVAFDPQQGESRHNILVSELVDAIS